MDAFEKAKGCYCDSKVGSLSKYYFNASQEQKEFCKEKFEELKADFWNE